jgi:hypothetical protein
MRQVVHATALINKTLYNNKPFGLQSITPCIARFPN